MNSIRIVRVLGTILVVSPLIITTAAKCQTPVGETVIHNFTGGSADGIQPSAALTGVSNLLGQFDSLYGVTSGAKTGVCAQSSCGSVYELSRPGPGQKAWIETTPFTNFVQSNGNGPAGGLVREESPFSWFAPSFAGTTLYGGTGSSSTSLESGNGIVFGLVGNQFGPLWYFTGGNDQNSPSGALITDDAAGVPGAVYGTTRGSHSPNLGTVYRIGNSVGSLSTVWSFSLTDGKRPLGGLLADQAGALYGMTFEGGAHGSARFSN
jgi:hypothetical protein